MTFFLCTKIVEKEVSGSNKYNKPQSDVQRQVVRGGLCGCLAGDETAPCLVALVNDLGGMFLVLRLAGEGKHVLGLAIGDLIDPAYNKHDE